MTDARLAAARVLLALEQPGTTLATSLARVRTGDAAARDRALLLELTMGVLRWRNALDAVVAACSRRPIESLTAEVRTILRLGAYQLRHLDRMPPHAVVHQSVELARRLGQPAAAGFVNGVLRQLLRRGASVQLPARPAASASRAARIRYLSVTLSHPAWLAARWLDRHGFDEAARWCAFNNTAPAVTVRVHPASAAAETLAAIRALGIEATAARYVPGALHLPSGALARLPADLRRRVVVQDEAAQIVAHAAGATPGERAVDLCAAPGGKTLVLAEAIGGRGLVVAADHRAARVRLLARTLAAAGARVPIVRLDAAQALPFRDVFDCVLLDAPCSGLGTVRRDPDIKWTRTEEGLTAYAATQRAMIHAAATAVRPGGRLIYATCSSEPEENDAVVEALRAARPDFALAPIAMAVTGLDAFIDDRGILRTLPFRDGLDAFFAARLVRRRAA